MQITRDSDTDPVAQRLRARRVRVRAIRRRVAALAAGTFVTVTGVIGVQLASGNDPALARSAAATPATSGDTSTASGTMSAATSGKTSTASTTAVTTHAS